MKRRLSAALPSLFWALLFVVILSVVPENRHDSTSAHKGQIMPPAPAAQTSVMTSLAYAGLLGYGVAAVALLSSR